MLSLGVPYVLFRQTFIQVLYMYTMQGISGLDVHAIFPFRAIRRVYQYAVCRASMVRMGEFNAS